jgi:hypothetical protein
MDRHGQTAAERGERGAMLDQLARMNCKRLYFWEGQASMMRIP